MNFLTLICPNLRRLCLIAGLLITFFSGCTTSHEKRIVYHYEPTYGVASLWCSIGSINFTSRSMKSNAEANVAVYDAQFAEQVRLMMQQDMGRCEQITSERWRQRSLYEHLKDVYFNLYKNIF